MNVLAIDPGPTRSGVVSFDTVTQRVIYAHIVDNDDLRAFLRVTAQTLGIGQVVIEKVEGFGMAVGVEVFETVYESGRFTECAAPIPVARIGRKAVKLHLCGSNRAKDANIRQAIMDRFGGSSAKGVKARPGPLYGVSAHAWSALAVALTWADQRQEV